MDSYHLRLPLLILLAAGCCKANLLPLHTNGVTGKSVEITATIPPEYQTGMVLWTFSTDDASEPVYSYAFEKETVGPRYVGRVSYYKNNSTLVIQKLTSDDSGAYILQVISPAGTLTGQTMLLVLETVANVKITPNLPEAVEFNSTVVLTCTAQGSLLTYKWLNGSASIPADGKHVVLNGSQLTIKEVLRTDLNGSIYCVAENNLESARSAPFNLTVHYGPDLVKATREPDVANLKKGSNLNLTCSAKSSPAAELKFLFNGAELSSTNNELHLANLKEDQSGNYSCVAFNSKTLRYATSQVFTVSVLEAISGTNISGSATPLFAGNSTCNLSCSSREGKADDVIWYKDGRPLDINKRITLASDKSTITITPVMKEDAGLYICQMSNKVNNDTSSSYSVTINYGPEDVVIKAPKQIEVGHRVVMNCTAASYPTPNFFWKFNETVLKATTSQYTIDSPDYMNTGTYTCTANNPLTGKSTSATHLMVVKGLGELNDQLSNGAIAGIIIAVLLVLAVIIGVILHKRRKIRDVPSPY